MRTGGRTRAQLQCPRPIRRPRSVLSRRCVPSARAVQTRIAGHPPLVLASQCGAPSARAPRSRMAAQPPLAKANCNADVLAHTFVYVDELTPGAPAEERMWRAPQGPPAPQPPTVERTPVAGAIFRNSASRPPDNLTHPGWATVQNLRNRLTQWADQVALPPWDFVAAVCEGPLLLVCLPPCSEGRATLGRKSGLGRRRAREPASAPPVGITGEQQAQAVHFRQDAARGLADCCAGDAPLGTAMNRR